MGLILRLCLDSLAGRSQAHKPDDKGYAKCCRPSLPKYAHGAVDVARSEIVVAQWVHVGVVGQLAVVHAWA